MDTKKTGSFNGKSNALGHGGRAAQMEAAGVPGGVIGEIARRKGAAPGGPNYHGGPPQRAGKGESPSEEAADKKAGQREAPTEAAEKRSTRLKALSSAMTGR